MGSELYEPMAETMPEDGDDCEAGPRATMAGPRRRPRPSKERRRELLALAVDLADLVEAKTQPHERCLLRGMVEAMVETR